VETRNFSHLTLFIDYWRHAALARKLSGLQSYQVAMCGIA
jgi:hypothetical protein